MTISELKPKEIWSNFEKITKVPRPSKKEEKIIEYLMNWAKEKNITAKKDNAGNILMSKPATKGFENKPTVILQSHMDMVCEKHSTLNFDFEKDAIKAVIDGEWVKAEGTTLGADDGIGMAAQMAILESTTIKHGAIECLFTVDEETGLSGAFALQPGFLTGKTLINLDSEDEGEIFIGCAGGIDTVGKFEYTKVKCPKAVNAFKITVSGLMGGHSGDDIHRGRANSLKILNRFLWFAFNEFELNISHFEGGNLRNAIPREAEAIVVVPLHCVEDFQAYFEHFSDQMKEEWDGKENNLKLTITETENPDKIYDEESAFIILSTIYALPHGVLEMSAKLEGLVETSTNLASVKLDKKEVVFTTSQRSSLESGKEFAASMVETVFDLAGMDVDHSDGYPGWAPNPKSDLLKKAVASYEKLFNKKPVVRAIHAGLECGLFLEKYPQLDMISIGPTLRGVHSPDERIEIESVEKWWKHLLDILENI